MTILEPEFGVISTLADAERIADEWRTIWLADTSAMIFQSFEWVVTWLDLYRSYVDEVFIITCYHQGALVGLCPFYLRYTKGLGFRQKQLLFVGTGEPEQVEVAAEYMNLLSLPEQRSLCLACISLALDSRRDIGAVMLFDLVEADGNPLIAALARKFPRNSGGQSAGFNYSVPVTDERLPVTFSSAMRKSAGTKLNRLERLGGFQVVLAQDEVTTDRLFRALVDLHNRRWKKKGKAGAFSEDIFCRFHRRVIELLLPVEAVLLFGLEVDGVIIAVHYCLLSTGFCHYYQGGIDEEFRPNVSPGLMCHVIAHQECKKRGIDRYDLMKGSEGDYKEKLAGKQNQLVSFRGFRDNSERLKHVGSHIARRVGLAKACA